MLWLTALAGQLFHNLARFSFQEEIGEGGQRGGLRIDLDQGCPGSFCQERDFGGGIDQARGPDDEEKGAKGYLLFGLSPGILRQKVAEENHIGPPSSAAVRTGREDLPERMPELPPTHSPQR